jgi:hypothetical protein
MWAAKPRTLELSTTLKTRYSRYGYLISHILHSLTLELLRCVCPGGRGHHTCFRRVAYRAWSISTDSGATM